MKYKRILILTLLLLLTITSTVFAQERRMKSPIFMGEVLEVQINEKDNIMQIRTKGYIKNSQVYKEEIIAIISEETILLPNSCPLEKTNTTHEKVNPVELTINKGDTVFMVLSEAMTKSIPPQVNAKAIKINTPN